MRDAKSTLEKGSLEVDLCNLDERKVHGTTRKHCEKKKIHQESINGQQDGNEKNMQCAMIKSTQ